MDGCGGRFHADQVSEHTLLGHYFYDIEGVAPQPVTLVEKGVLKIFFHAHAGVQGLSGLQRARADDRIVWRSSPGFGNLFIRASQTTPAAEMKQKLIDLCKQQNKPYGILIRKLDFPSSASTRARCKPGGAHAVTSPLLAYKIYPDGREELVRGLQFHGVSTRSFKDIVAASDENYVFDFIDSNATFARMARVPISPRPR